MTFQTFLRLLTRRALFFMLISVITLPLPLEAQKQKGRSGTTKNKSEKNLRSSSTTSANDTKKVDAAALIEAYRFDDAARLIERDIKAAERAGQSTVLLEEDLRRARLGADMLRGTERVIFVDSIVLPRVNFLSAYRLSQGCGTIAPLAHLVPALGRGKVGQTAYMNDFGDRVIYAAPDTAGRLKLCAADRLGGQWSAGQPLQGMGSEDDIQDYPYMMADGVTLYFAAQGSESLGGYDIFVSRYNASTGAFVKAENLGMPFNSPANDYLMAIDETTGAGWFVTDRRQPADSVCVYCFIPSASREIYDVSSENEDRVRSLARIDAIADSQTDGDAVAAVQERLRDLQLAGTLSEKTGTGSDATGSLARRYVIDDANVYTNLSQFRNTAAQRLAREANELRQQLVEAQQQLAELRASATTSAQKAKILQLESEIATLHSAIGEKEKAMRRAELGK